MNNCFVFRRAFRHSFFAVVPLIFLAILFSCNNVITDNTKNTPPSQPNSVKTVTITGYVRNPYAEAGYGSRAAFPSSSFSDTRYSVTATAQDVSGEVTGTANATTFSIPLALGKVWTLTLTMQKKEDGDTDYKTVMETSYTINHALTEADVTTSLTLELKPLMTENGTGKINLSFSSSPTGLYDDVSVEIGNLAQKAAWDDAVLVGTSGISMKTGQDGEPCKLNSGVYSVTLSFFRNGVLVYATTQEINVFDDMTTSRWVDGSTQNTPISGGSFVLTESDINRFKYTNYFVASSTSSPAGDNGNSGSPYAPLATVSEALRRIAETGDEDDEYTIWLMSDITDNVEMSGSDTDGLDGKASSITIKPWHNGSATLSGASGRVLSVFTTVPLTLENLTITGGSTSVSGGGMYIDSSAEVTLANCTVKGNSVTGSGLFSGGIYNAGTLKVKGKVTVTDNTRVTGSSTAASNVYLASGKIITVIDELDPGSRIGVTTATKPSYGSPVVFTSGFGEKSGLAAAAISTIFTCDEGYAVIAGTDANAGEATLQASGGNMGDVFDYSVALSCVNSTVASGSVLTVEAAVTNDGTPVTLAADDITWNFELTCFDKTVVTLPSTSAAIARAPGYARVAILPTVRIFEGVQYTLHATATYNGVGYDKAFNLTGGSVSGLPQGFVAVVGATVSGAVSGSSVFIAGGTITIPNMYVCDHEVTQAEFQAVMGMNPSEFNGSEGKEPADGEIQTNRPAESMTWYAAVAYCNKKSILDGLTPCYSVNGITDWQNLAYSSIPTENDTTWNAVTCDFSANGYRLPTEAEWEYIARGVNNGMPATQTTYSGSNNIGDVTWYYDNSENMTHEVKLKDPNSLGIYDMSGNVWEWCWDWKSSMGGTRSGRGGSWDNEEPSYCAVSHQNTFYPYQQYPAVGFRVVRTTWYAHETPVALAAGTNGTAGTSGTYMLLGDWPQTIKADGVTVDENISKQMGTLTYYYGSDGAWYAKLAENAYETGYTYSDGSAVMQGGTSYVYFKVEPIKWRVLTESFDHDSDGSTAGKKLLLAENALINDKYYDDISLNRIIDGNGVSTSNYEHSRIRAYLNGIDYNKSGTNSSEFSENGGFLGTAFTSVAQGIIAQTTVVSNARSANPSYNATRWNGGANNYTSDTPTEDKVFILSMQEVTTADYGFAANEGLDTARYRLPTDFAKANGTRMSNVDSSLWWIRSPFDADSRKTRYAPGGLNDRAEVSTGYFGVVPALCIE